MKDWIIYTHILIESLKKKKQSLGEILKYTKEQERILGQESFEEELFENLIDKKQKSIEVINKLDEGFDLTFERVKIELNEHREMFKNEILTLQGLIREITEISTQIQVLENRNKVAFENKMRLKRDNIKMARLSSQSVSKYYQNVANAYNGESIFLDKKKWLVILHEIKTNENKM